MRRITRQHLHPCFGREKNGKEIGVVVFQICRDFRSGGHGVDPCFIGDREGSGHDVREFPHAFFEDAVVLHDLFQRDLRQTVHLVIVYAMDEVISPQMIVRGKKRVGIFVFIVIFKCHIREEIVPADFEDFFFLSVRSKHCGEIRQIDDDIPILAVLENVQRTPYQVRGIIRGAAPGWPFTFQGKVLFQRCELFLERNAVKIFVRHLPGDDLHAPDMSIQQMDDVHHGLVFRIGILVEDRLSAEWENVLADFAEKFERRIIVQVSEAICLGPVFVLKFQLMPCCRKHMDVSRDAFFQGEIKQSVFLEERGVVDVVQQEQQTSLSRTFKQSFNDQSVQSPVIFLDLLVLDPELGLDVPSRIRIFHKGNDRILPVAFPLHVDQETALRVFACVAVGINGRQLRFAGPRATFDDRVVIGSADLPQFLQFQDASHKALSRRRIDAVEPFFRSPGLEKLAVDSFF